MLVTPTRNFYAETKKEHETTSQQICSSVTPQANPNGSRMPLPPQFCLATNGDVKCPFHDPYLPLYPSPPAGLEPKYP
ncbi:hypothetical protein BaRGS_00038053 [Batillaria attramentaria]|uniref:Uncharacterized protein n=1 Tax=Batillaria attramentaria TaxID=370345 RepID=A0ABD0J737_9CAEN